MPSIPNRNLGAVGIVKDVDPFSLPPNAFSDGINVRFDNNKVQRAPVFRVLYGSLTGGALTGTVPVFCYGVYSPTSFDSVIYANNDGRLFSVANSTEVNVTEPGHVNNVDPRPYTGCNLAQCVYINRPDQAPRVLLPAATAFEMLPNWPSGWSCQALRSYAGFLLAINVTQAGVSSPNQINWSDQTLNATVPDSWDVTDATKLAGFNVLAEIRTPLVDGGQLGDNFILYSKDETWVVYQTANTEVFGFDRLPYDNAGSVNANCWVEIDGQHYVWGENDIYVHNGVQKRSIIDQRNREVFFRELNMKLSNVFFAIEDKYRHEIIFCGVSGSSDAAFPNAAGFCNYGAVYNYVKDTWSFVDLPNVSMATTANANTVWTYATVPSSITYDNVGGSYFDQTDSFSRYCVFSSVASSSYGLTTNLHVLDNADTGKLALAIDPATVTAAWAHRTGLSLDEIGAELRGYKQARAVIPQIAVYAPGVTMDVQVGAQLVSGAPVTWDAVQTFAPAQNYKIDTRQSGRYLAFNFEMSTANDFDVTGFDFDVLVTGRR